MNNQKLNLLHEKVAKAVTNFGLNVEVLECDPEFADSETTKQLTDMEIGGVVAVGIDGYPIYVDKAVLNQEKVVMGGGNRTSKLSLDPNELLKLPHVQVVDDLANPV